MYGALGSLGGGLMSLGAGQLGNNSAGSGQINTDVNIADTYMDTDFYNVDGMQINQMGGSTNYYNLNNTNSTLG